MNEYEVVIEETVVQRFNVVANSASEAAEIGRQNYKSGEFVVDNGELEEANVMATGNGEETEWVNIY